MRDRLLAGAMLPAAWIERAQKFRRPFRDQMLALFGEVDAILAPATPMRAPQIGQKTAIFGGIEMPLRPNIGIFTQPFSFIGLPVAAVPIALEGQTLPIGRADHRAALARGYCDAGGAAARKARGGESAGGARLCRGVSLPLDPRRSRSHTSPRSNRTCPMLSDDRLFPADPTTRAMARGLFGPSDNCR